MEEKRKYRRSPAKEKAYLQAKEHNKQHESQLLDVSSGGMRILSQTSLKTGTMLSGSFKIMPAMGNFYVLGEVVWVKPLADETHNTAYEIGIRFNKVSTIPEH